MSSNKDLNVLIKEARKQGWDVDITNGGHYKWVSPVGSFFYSSFTPSDWRAITKIKRDLRLNGFVEITRKKGRR